VDLSRRRGIDAPEVYNSTTGWSVVPNVFEKRVHICSSLGAQLDMSFIEELIGLSGRDEHRIRAV